MFHPGSVLQSRPFVDTTKEIARRRTFAIISHPDAGKTTLTEKLLLYGGAVQLAGSVTARKHQRASTSDWMELERKRGISISSTVLQFEYDGYYINLLDTPGHKDFSEDTYRVLTAVDAVVMVIDAGKGIESQTRKLFEVCRQRQVPIFTFMNKCDRPTLEPLALLDELERVLRIGAFPVNWPIGTGLDFKGVYDRQGHQVHLFERTVGGAYRAPVTIGGCPTSTGATDTATINVTLDDALLTPGNMIPVHDLKGRQSDGFYNGATFTPGSLDSAMSAPVCGVQRLTGGTLSYTWLYCTEEPKNVCGNAPFVQDNTAANALTTLDKARLAWIIDNPTPAASNATTNTRADWLFAYWLARAAGELSPGPGPPPAPPAPPRPVAPPGPPGGVPGGGR